MPETPALTLLAPQAQAVDFEEILLHLLLDLAIIIIAARMMGGLAKALGQPAVIGEVLAGILMGPTVLGRIDSSFQMDLFPHYVPLREIANLGLVFFMFLVGLELDPKLIRGQGKRAVQISLSGVAAPLVLGLLVGYALYDVNVEGCFPADEAGECASDATGFELPEKFTFALFLGSAMCITAFPVLARILVETGLYKTAVGTATLCAAAVDDVTAWILLAAVVGIAETGSPAEALPALGLTAVFVVFMVVVGRRLLELLAKRSDASGRLTVDQVAIILVGVLLAAYATERIGIHAIFGAFIFGAVMPKRSWMTQQLTDKVEDFVIIVMLPVFFLVTGLRTDLFTLDSFDLVGYLLIILTVAIAGKFLGCGIAARLTGSSTRDSIVVGALMNTRGLTELVILGIGLELGVLSDRIFAMMVIMALVTTFMAAPIVSRIFPREEFLKEVGEQEKPAPTATRILVALGSVMNAPSLVDAGIRLAGKRRPAELLLVRLIPPPRAPELRSGLQDEELETGASVESMRLLVEQAEAAGVGARPISFLSEDVGKDLARLAGDQKCDYLVLGWYRPSVAQEIVQVLVRRTFSLTPSDVVIVADRQGQGPQPKPEAPVVVALNGGSHDDAAVEVGVRLAENVGAGIKLLGYVNGKPGRDPAADSRDLALQADALRARTGLWVVPEFRPDGMQAIIEEVPQAAVTVMGVGDDWVSGGAFGRPATALVEQLSSPALIVRGAMGVGAPSAAKAAEVADSWPFITPTRGREEPEVTVTLPARPHLQRLDPYGEPVEALTIADGLSIGRAPGNRLTLEDDKLVSRLHASVDRRNGRHVIRDLGSTNGTMLWRDQQWRPVVDEELEDGDLLVIGANVFRFSTGASDEEV
jgi:Kef-type K+ transport system membrane component KefB/nucleotide-binding universal stress UspA family protein